jgi:hypothetical protein
LIDFGTKSVCDSPVPGACVNRYQIIFTHDGVARAGGGSVGYTELFAQRPLSKLRKYRIYTPAVRYPLEPRAEAHHADAFDGSPGTTDPLAPIANGDFVCVRAK